ncbi:hypothetical protein RE6C_04002 [Rhodopirellula europaea 6C]|uniref:Uncharacterized protein n=1 Tax=Rhodopirellula europaea 6C TaxID=1263867 RepID=M2B0G0_9BACT|nr:hypothetical protein RE6C_04002 [Rhodopirellula europaea 6C]
MIRSPFNDGIQLGSGMKHHAILQWQCLYYTLDGSCPITSYSFCRETCGAFVALQHGPVTPSS